MLVPTRMELISSLVFDLLYVFGREVKRGKGSFFYNIAVA
jgi:hypothetical protein